MKFTVTPALVVDQNQNVAGAVVAKFAHQGTDFSLRVNDSVRDGDILGATRLGMKNDTMELAWDCGSNTGRMVMHGALNVKDRAIKVKATTLMNAAGTDSYLNCTSDLDSDNTVRLIMHAKGGERPSHKNMVLGFIHRQADFEIEPRYNFSTESVSCGVTYNMDSENKLRAIFDMNSNQGSLQWTNNGGLGGDGELRITARATMDKDGLKQMPSVTVEKCFDVDF